MALASRACQRSKAAGVLSFASRALAVPDHLWLRARSVPARLALQPIPSVRPRLCMARPRLTSHVRLPMGPPNFHLSDSPFDADVTPPRDLFVGIDLRMVAKSLLGTRGRAVQRAPYPRQISAPGHGQHIGLWRLFHILCHLLVKTVTSSPSGLCRGGIAGECGWQTVVASPHTIELLPMLLRHMVHSPPPLLPLLQSCGLEFRTRIRVLRVHHPEASPAPPGESISCRQP
jgi:hypothetical protein